MIGLAVGLITGRRELVAAIVGAGVAVGVALVSSPVDRDRLRRDPRTAGRHCSSRSTFAAETAPLGSSSRRTVPHARRARAGGRSRRAAEPGGTAP